MGNICIEKQKQQNLQEISEIQILPVDFNNQKIQNNSEAKNSQHEAQKYKLIDNKTIKQILPEHLKNFDYNTLDLECLEQILDNKDELYRNEEEKYYFQGKLQENNKTGFCQVCWDDGNFVAGKFNQDKLNGKGFYINKSGDFYQGTFVSNQFNGKGILKNLYNKTQYFGEFKNDKKEGKGTEKWPDGSKYIGQYKNNKKSGKGWYKFSDHSQYVGNFKSDQIHGQGKIQWHNGQSYEGEFFQNQLNGYGTFIWSDGTIFKGYFRNNKKQGHGEILWKNGISFQGNFVNDKQEGKGVMIDKHGRVTVGMWKQGLLQDDIKFQKFQKIVKEKLKQNLFK